jgi:class 3 adenylate cyclase/tetratricopeptide (TPR) repeat protein
VRRGGSLPGRSHLLITAAEKAAFRPSVMFCHACGQSLPEAARYCIGCGARAMTLAPAPAPNLTERKFATIMFTDMVGSLHAIQDKDPEDAHLVLATAMTVMAQAVHAFGGVVAETAGDGIMAIFGAPAAMQDHAVRACFAALRLHALAAEALHPLSLRVGINSGEVAVGVTPNDFASDFTATGVVVHIAARLQSCAQPRQTVMTAGTAALVRGAMRTVPLGAFQLKGLSDPIELHGLIGPQQPESESRSRTFVGRFSELALLTRSHDAARSGHGQIVALRGDAGIGKSALVDRFAVQIGVKVVRCTCEYRAGVASLQTVADLITQLARLATLPPNLHRAALHEWLTELSIGRPYALDAMTDLLGLGGLSEPWTGLAPLLRSDRIAETVMLALLADSARRDRVLVIEDLQRADSGILDLVDRLISGISDSRLMLIVTFRPDLDSYWGSKPNCHLLRLERLNDEETRALLGDFFGHPASPRLEQQLIGWSNGNPLFLREGIRALREAGVDEDPDAAAAISIPQSINAAIAERIDRLAPQAKKVLLAASVLGATFSVDLLSQVAGIDHDALDAQIGSLEDEEFVHTVQAEPRICGFEHDLFREVGYTTLLRRQRRDLHQAAFRALSMDAEVIEAPNAEERLAHHAYGGELWAEAVEVCREAGRRATARYANREAALHFENALDALSRADSGGTRLRDAIALRLELRTVCLPMLRLDRIGALLAECDELAKQLGDLELRTRIAGYAANHAYLTQGAEPCLALCDQAEALATAAGHAQLSPSLVIYRAQADYALGRYRQVIAALHGNQGLLDPLVTAAQAGLPVRPVFMRGYWLAIAHAELGRFGTAFELSESLVTASDDRQPFESLYARTAQGFIAMLQGDYPSALAHSHAALATAEHYEIAFIIPVLASQVGFLLARTGHTDEGVIKVRQALRKAEEINSVAGRSRWYARAGEACLRAGMMDEARHHANAAVESAQKRGELAYLCSARRLRAKLHALNSEHELAFEQIDIALTLSMRIRSAPALAKSLFDAALIHDRLDADRSSGRSGHMLSTAFRLFNRHGMTQAARLAEDLLQRSDTSGPSISATDLFGSSE